MSIREEIVEYSCGAYRVYGVLNIPEQPSSHGLVVIGRTMSDRQAVYVGRAAARAGLPAFRLDFRGRSYCEGPVVPVEETGEDLAAAIQAFQSITPEVATFTIMGLSEGATAALLYAYADARVTRLILVNPWIRVELQVAREHLKMNVARIRDAAFWKRIRRSEAGLTGAAHSFLKLLQNVAKAPGTGDGLKQRVVEGLERFTGKVCIILGGEDPATAVFQRATAEHLKSLNAIGRLSVHTVQDADHVFSGMHSREKLVTHSVNWALGRV